MMTRDEAIARIRKLLALADNDGATEPEAALAAQRAQDLMERFDVEQAALDVPTETEDPVERTDWYVPAAAWRRALAYGVTKAQGCKAVTLRGRMGIVGRRSDVMVARYLYDYLAKTIERLGTAAVREYTAQGHVHPGPRAYGNAWRLGCAARVRQRLIEAKQARVQANDSLGALVRATSALVEQRFRAEWPRTRKGSRASVGSSAGFQAGVAAGNGIAIRSGIGGGASPTIVRGAQRLLA